MTSLELVAAEYHKLHKDRAATKKFFLGAAGRRLLEPFADEMISVYIGYMLTRVDQEISQMAVDTATVEPPKKNRSASPVLERARAIGRAQQHKPRSHYGVPGKYVEDIYSWTLWGGARLGDAKKADVLISIEKRTTHIQGDLTKIKFEQLIHDAMSSASKAVRHQVSLAQLATMAQQAGLA